MNIESHSISPKRDQEKFIFRLKDELLISSVFIHYQLSDGECRHILSISSQVGCPLACRFCRSGEMGLYRNLSAQEIADQYFLVKQKSEWQQATHIEFGNMGEPLLNYNNVLDASNLMLKSDFTSMPPKIIITTSGIVPDIEKLIREDVNYELAISLNATTEEIRNTIMPVNSQYPLDEVFRIANEYNRKTGRRIIFKYMLLAGINDSIDDAKRLKSHTSDIPCEIEVFPYVSNFGNGTNNSDFQAPSNDRIRAFTECLN